MRKLTLYIAACLLMALTACEDKATEGLSYASPVPQFVMLGESIELLQQGESYEDAGVKAFEVVDGDTTELSGVEVLTTLEESLPGTYVVNYSVKNSMGDTFHAPVSRKVVVYNDDITGVYHSTVVRDGSVMDMTGVVLIVKVDEGVYSHSDWIGGWYDQYYGYGSRYAFGGFMGIDEAGVVTHKNSSDPWGYAGSINADASFDASTGTIHYVYSWTAGYNFDVTLIKQ
ncbi:BT_2262 family domain-containing protein [Sediminitomix flava]|uniref:Uncharacterized protein DUF5011 n=1 Tax=Sediminitomix flava TaxID=379075 RepID=A0A315Z7S6_SEDFL|nr:BT_2262 family domain-containing protein [Sediminitomix flava]PWJ40981.1 uncharacterized protein DUF5011 [Sediminitomix flava]